MTITINGTTGIAGVDGSASTPAVQGTDTNTGIFFPAADTIAFGEGGAEVARFNADAQFVAAAGTASLPVITTTGDVNTGIFFPAADTIAFAEGGAEAMRITSTGDVGIGTSTPTFATGTGLQVKGAGVTTVRVSGGSSTGVDFLQATDGLGYVYNRDNNGLVFGTNNTERARIDSSGNLMVGATSSGGHRLWVELSGGAPLGVNRITDGNLVVFYESGTIEGTISVSGTTVSYNGGHLSRWAQMLTKPDLLKGTVMSNLDEMNVYTKDGEPIANEQLNKVKVSDVEGDVNVAGVFVNWTYDDAHQVDEINMAMTGDMIIRIAQGVVVQKGDLLMSAGDGTAKPQGDDIVRSKTVAKVTSNHVTCTYADGSYCVPCVLMAC